MASPSRRQRSSGAWAARWRRASAAPSSLPTARDARRPPRRGLGRRGSMTSSRSRSRGARASGQGVQRAPARRAISTGVGVMALGSVSVSIRLSASLPASAPSVPAASAARIRSTSAWRNIRSRVGGLDCGARQGRVRRHLHPVATRADAPGLGVRRLFGGLLEALKCRGIESSAVCVNLHDGLQGPATRQGPARRDNRQSHPRA